MIPENYFIMSYVLTPESEGMVKLEILQEDNRPTENIMTKEMTRKTPSCAQEPCGRIEQGILIQFCILSTITP
jgi:hypothetical protein